MYCAVASGRGPTEGVGLELLMGGQPLDMSRSLEEEDVAEDARLSLSVQQDRSRMALACAGQGGEGAGEQAAAAQVESRTLTPTVTRTLTPSLTPTPTRSQSSVIAWQSAPRPLRLCWMHLPRRWHSEPPTTAHPPCSRRSTAVDKMWWWHRWSIAGFATRW